MVPQLHENKQKMLNVIQEGQSGKIHQIMVSVAISDSLARQRMVTQRHHIGGFPIS